MFFYNLPKIVGMFLNRKNRKMKKEIQKMYKQDSNFSRINTLKYMLKMIQGEKIVKHEGKYIISSFFPPLPTTAFMQLATATPEKENIYTQQMYSQRSAPISTFIALTYKCDYNCKYCSAKGRQQGTELSTIQWKNVITDLQDMGTSVIGITGGEPLLRDDLDEIVESIDERSISVLFTNGKGFSLDKAKSLKERGLFSVGISLDTHEKMKFNEIRNNEEAFDNSIEALKNAIKAGLYTMIQTVLFKNNATKENFLELLKLGKKLKVNEIRILEPIRSGNLFDNKEMEEVFMDKETKQKIIGFQNKYNRKIGFPKITVFPHTESKERFGCGAGSQHSYITPIGELLPCDFVPLSFGNVKETSVKELWKDMNKVIGIPKSNCFANEINSELKEFKDNIFPLEEDISKAICSKHKSSVYPGFYRAWQGK